VHIITFLPDPQNLQHKPTTPSGEKLLTHQSSPNALEKLYYIVIFAHTLRFAKRTMALRRVRNRSYHQVLLEQQQLSSSANKLAFIEGQSKANLRS